LKLFFFFFSFFCAPLSHSQAWLSTIAKHCPSWQPNNRPPHNLSNSFRTCPPQNQLRIPNGRCIPFKSWSPLVEPLLTRSSCPLLYIESGCCWVTISCGMFFLFFPFLLLNHHLHIPIKISRLRRLHRSFILPAMFSTLVVYVFFAPSFFFRISFPPLFITISAEAAPAPPYFQVVNFFFGRVWSIVPHALPSSFVLPVNKVLFSGLFFS